MGRLGPVDLQQAAPRLRLRKVGSRAPHVEIGGQPRLVPQGHDIQRLFLQRGRFLQQFQLRAGAAIFDILAGDGRGDDPAGVGANIIRLGIAGGGGAYLGAQSTAEIGIEQDEQTRAGKAAVVPLPRRHTDIGRTIHAGQKVGSFGPQQRLCCADPVARRGDVEIGGKPALYQRIQHGVAETLPPVVGQPRLGQRRAIGRRRIDRGLRLDLGNGRAGRKRAGGQHHRQETANRSGRHAGAIVMSSSIWSISSLRRARSTERGFPKRAMPR